ncbi:uncharacterized protein LOC143895425 [Temnothorax americanus]|uniref:uncharacterized protein LOC143895425 n=1 Tax=Temnothorax americanus TaxID=1964332 RepID=UPI0040684BA4
MPVPSPPVPSSPPDLSPPVLSPLDLSPLVPSSPTILSPPDLSPLIPSSPIVPLLVSMPKMIDKFEDQEAEPQGYDGKKKGSWPSYINCHHPITIEVDEAEAEADVESNRI